MPNQSKRSLSKILVPTDFSSNSQSAVHYACDLASGTKAELHLLHVTKGKMRPEEEERLVKRMTSLLSARSELSLATFKAVAAGKPDETIADYAHQHEVDLVVMGTHGRTGLAHLTMGSVAENVVRRSPCPVVVLGPGDASEASLDGARNILRKIIGNGLEMSVEDGRTRILKALAEQLRIPSTSAIRMFDELQSSGQLKWNDGQWTLDLPFEQESALPLALDEGADSHALDLVVRAHNLRATDVHIDPINEDETLIRFRIDGQLREYCKMNRSLAEHMCNQLRTMARVSITDPFHPQEGRLRLPAQLSRIEVRMTAVPVSGGHALALRLFDPSKIFVPLEDLGFSEQALESVQKMLQSEEGLILVTGPTGAGKTTTVYSMLQTIGGKVNNIVSIEDPVEFSAPFVRQISVDEAHRLSISEGLRTILRMDPDVLFIGEIRDSAAAKIGMQAATSGRYVFSTMHTRNVASTISSLRGLGLDDRAVASNLTGIINQRIVRRLCNACKKSVGIDDRQREEFARFGLDVPDCLFEPVGCDVCSGSGVFGRIGIFEVARMNEPFREAILDRKSDQEIDTLLVSQAIDDLQRDALRKAARGWISFQDAVVIRWVG